MKPSKKNKWLDQIISRSAPIDKPVPNFKKWRQEHPKAVDILKSQGTQRNFPAAKMTTVPIWRRIMRSKITKFAAAAVILIAAGVGIAVLSQVGEQGVVFTMWVDKLVWNAGEIPTFKADLVHRGKRELVRFGGYELEFDGTWYVDSGDGESTRKGYDPKVFRPDTAYRDIGFALDNRWLSRQSGNALKLITGRHRIRLAFNAKVPYETTDKLIRIVSDVAEFRILEAGESVTEQDWLEIAVGGQPGLKYSEEQVAAMYLEKYGKKLSPGELADFYYEKAFELSQRGGDAHELAEFAECALAFEQEDVARLRLYSILGGAYQGQTKKYSPELWARQRRIAAMVYLAGLSDALGYDLPAKRPERVGVFTYYDDSRKVRVGHLPHMTVAVARDADRVRALVEHRQVLTQQIVSMYAREPDAFEELHELAMEYIGDEMVAAQLVEGAKAYRKSSRSPIPAIIIENEVGLGEMVSTFQVYDTNGVSIEAGFVPDKTEIISGEPVFITFYVKNIGDKPYRFFVGGDNRGSVRHNNFRITAVDVKGQLVKDPYSYDNFGGRGNNINLESGDIYAERLYLDHWCAFEKPGVYTVTCKRTLNDRSRSSNNPEVPIVVSFELNIAPYDKEKMGKVITAFGEQLRSGGNGALREVSLALSAIDDEEVIPYLVESMRSKGDWRSKNPAIEGLCRFSTNASIKALILGLEDPDHVVSKHAAKALTTMGKKDYVVDVLAKKLEDNQASVRALAVKALGEMRSERAFEPLMAALHDKDAEVQYAVAKALGTLGDPRCSEVLKRYVEDEDFGLRLAAVKGMVALKQPIQAKWLTPIIKATTDINDQKFHEAIRILRLYGKDQAAPGLVSCLQFDDPSLRNAYNMFLILAIESSPGGPKYYYKYHHNPNIDGSPEQIEENHRILEALKSWLEAYESKADAADVLTKRSIRKACRFSLDWKFLKQGCKNRHVKS